MIVGTLYSARMVVIINNENVNTQYPTVKFPNL